MVVVHGNSISEGGHHWTEKTKQTYQRNSRNIRSGQVKQFGIFLKRRNTLAGPATPKALENHGRELKWMIAEFLPSQHSNQVKNTLEEEGVSLSKSIFERQLHECKYSGRTSR